MASINSHSPFLYWLEFLELSLCTAAHFYQSTYSHVGNQQRIIWGRCKIEPQRRIRNRRTNPIQNSLLSCWKQASLALNQMHSPSDMQKIFLFHLVVPICLSDIAKLDIEEPVNIDLTWETLPFFLNGWNLDAYQHETNNKSQNEDPKWSHWSSRYYETGGYGHHYGRPHEYVPRS